MGETRTATGEAVVTSEVGSRRLRLASPTTAGILGAVTLSLVISVIPLAGLAHKFTTEVFGPTVVGLAFGLVGVVVAARQPRQPMGWLLMSIGGFFAVAIDASFYSLLDYRMHHGTLPLGAVAVLLLPSWAPTILLLGLTILLFPDGLLPSRRWRWVLWPYLALGGLLFLGAVFIAAQVIVEHRIHIDSSGNLTALSGSAPAYRWWNTAQALVLPALLLSWASWLVLLFVRFRRSTGERHEQLKWLAGGAGCCIVSLPVLLFSGSSWSSVLAKVLGGAALLGITALPISIGIGVLKYRLYEIDRVVSRTLSYAIVTGIVIGVYVGIVTLVTRVLGFSSPVAVAASTLAALALFNPVRVRVQHVVDRRFNRAHYDAEATVAAFRTRLRDAVDLETVRSELLEFVNRSVEPAHASVWIRPHKSD